MRAFLDPGTVGKVLWPPRWNEGQNLGPGTSFPAGVKRPLQAGRAGAARGLQGLLPPCCVLS